MAVVVVVSLFAGGKESSPEDYLLPGRSLGRGLIGMSLIFSNISTGDFVGMVEWNFGMARLAIAQVFMAW